MPSFKTCPQFMLGSLLMWGMVSCLMLLPGCAGYQPLYGSATPAAQQLPLVQVNNIPNRLGQQLRNRLIDRFYGNGRPEAPEYTLDVALNQSIFKLGIEVDDSATRAELNVQAVYTLRNSQGAAVLTGATTAVNYYNILRGQYATLTAEEDAYDRSVAQISDDITRRLSLYFNREPVRAG